MFRSDEKEYWDLIWEKFRAGDRRAFETIYNEFADALFAYGSNITPHKALVEDAIQDVFIDIYKYSNRLKKPESLEFYLYKALKNNIIKKLKEKHRFSHPDDFIQQFDVLFPVEESESDELEENIEKLKQELLGFDAKRKELLFLRYNSGLSYKEIAALLHCQPDTVKKQVHRILKLLRGKLGEDFLELFVMFVRK